MILITIIIILALQQWLLADTEGEHDIAHIASSIILASLRAGFFLPTKWLRHILILLSIYL
ncbi:hypothetical protein KCQ_03490 [Pectobacterium atrosepticum ICMP 1526]|nr:hypothetical protein EV46_09520 [Pectobacterium atrosepticum]ATY91161.1 hypothetical protein CVS35_12770 [Pectobacterium atrosepticum]KFX17904.1 hypothetical protein JV34_02480 [Pectobacterium atrosepticum]KFX25929.1 hypothetical protein KP24_04425 [Pectobacterium atrosepticum]KMK88928.1 hypothetical protein KCQ_03490 [Pectobacterium atrosepticum ICMP 1526]